LLTVTGLTPGRSYELQFMISDDRPGFRERNYDVSDGADPEGSRDIERAYHSTAGTGLPSDAPAGSIEAKIFTGSFIADASGTQNIFDVLYENPDHTGGNSGSQVNAIQVRAVDRVGTPVPEALSPWFGAIVLAGTVGAGSWFRRHNKNASQSGEPAL
jgi:hypothetical protein